MALNCEARATGVLIWRYLLMPINRSVAILFFLAALIGFVWSWENAFTKSNELVVYFGRPSAIPAYIASNWNYLIWASFGSVRTAVLSLVLAGLLATLLLVIGLVGDGLLGKIESLAVWSQAVPFLVVVTVFFLAERILFKAVDWNPGTSIYSLVPVTISLVFPPLVYGAKGTMRLQVQIKSLLRLWQAPTFLRITRVYLPNALPDILTGLRVSATWAVGATLISDGLLDGVAMNERTLGHLLVRPFSTAPSGQTPTVIVIATLLAIGVYFLARRAQAFVEQKLNGDSVRIEEAYS